MKDSHFRRGLTVSCCSVLFAFGLLFLGGPGGCGSSSGGGSGGGGSSETGATVNSVDDIPSLNIEDYYDTGSDAGGLMAAFKAQEEGSGGGFCKEFCYNKQCLQETLRHSVQIEFNLCMLRKAKEASDGVFDFPADGCTEFAIIPPEFEGGEEGGGPGDGPPDDGPALKTKKTKTISADAPSDFIIRLCTDGDTKKVHLCEGGELHDELILTNGDDGHLSAKVTNRFSFGDCTDSGQMNIASNCNADSFTNEECVADFDAIFSGCFGQGTINFSVTGGDTRSYDLEANFSSGEDSEFGEFNSEVKALWDAGGTGTFKSVGSGAFPAFPAEGIPLDDIHGCKTLAAAKPVLICPSDNFDPETFDPAVPVCPFRAAEGGVCQVEFSDVQCCTISGGTLAEQEGALAEDAVCGDQFTTVSEFPFPDQSIAVNFVDEYDCNPSSTTPVNLRNAAGVDFSECFGLFEKLQDQSAGTNCEEEGAQEGIEDINDEFEEGGTCTNDGDCEKGENCDIFPGDKDGFCIGPPPSCTTDANCTGQCFEDEECACVFLENFGAKGCVPVFHCEDNFDCPPDATCDKVIGECVHNK